MDVRCQNCGERITVPAHKPTDTTVELTCPSCGVSMSVRVARPATNGKPVPTGMAEDEPRPTTETWKRVFEPLPRTLIYFGGGFIALVLLSPFWITILQERYGRNPVILSEDTVGLNTPISSPTNDAVPIMSAPDRGATTLDQFHNVRLEAGREDVQHRFNLRLLNTRGMEPEIYEASRSGDLERLTAYFYGGVLKEAFLVGREQKVTPDFIQNDLIEQFGPPAQQTEIPGPLPSSSPFGMTADELKRKLEEFPFHRNLVWADAQYRVEATIHYSAAEPANCRSVLALHLSAAAWLRSRQPLSATLPALR